MNRQTTIRGLVDELYLALAEEPEEIRLDLSPADVGRVVGLFLLKLAANPPTSAANEILERIGRECMAVRDE